jgi:hypothetical protein
MADRTIEVLEPATEFDLLTLEEAKLLLGYSSTDTSHDEILAMWIMMFSATVSELCNRTFAKEKVTETWRDTYNGRLFLSHWPIKHEDVELVTAGTAGAPLDTTAYELEQQSGKLSFIANPGGAASAPWSSPAVVTYTGGYDLPDEAPWPLKQATVLLIRDEKIRMQTAQVAGIRQINHKHARVSFFDPNAILIKTAGMKSPAMQAATTLLRQYMRFEV